MKLMRDAASARTDPAFLTLRHEMQMAAVVVHYSVDVWKSLKKVKKKGIALAQALCANELLEVDHQATMRNRKQKSRSSSSSCHV